MHPLKKLMRDKTKKPKQPAVFGVIDDFDFSMAIQALNEVIASTLVFKLPFTYKDYLRTVYWKLRTSLYKEHFQDICQRCHKERLKGMALHHLTYDTLRQEGVDDLLLVCRVCHFLLEQEKEFQ